MPGSYLVAGARTPIGKLSGALSSLAAADLGAVAIAAAVARVGVAADDVDHVIVGQVLMAGQGQVPSRQAAVKAGIPMRACRQRQQGLPVRAQRHLPRRPDDRHRRGRRRRRRRHRVDDQRPVPRRRGAGRLPLRQHRAARLDHRRRPVVRVRRPLDGPRDGALRRVRSAATNRTPSPPCRTSAPRRRSRRAASPRRSSPCRSIRAQAEAAAPILSSSSTTRACARKPRPRA